MKQTLLAFLLVFTLFAVTACGNKADDSTNTPSKSSTEKTEYIAWSYSPEEYLNIYEFILNKIVDLKTGIDMVSSSIPEDATAEDDLSKNQEYRFMVYYLNNWAYGADTFDTTELNDPTADKCFELMRAIGEDLRLLCDKLPEWWFSENSNDLLVWKDRTINNVNQVVEIAENGVTIPVNDKDTIVIANNCEFYVDYSNISNKIEPINKNRVYSFYEAESGKTYVDFCIAYKNLQTQSVRAEDVLSASLTYADKYEYSGFSIIEEDSRGNFTYSNITDISPLATEYIHYLFGVPSELQASQDSLIIKFQVGGNLYSYSVR